MSKEIVENIRIIKSRIAHACKKYGRDPNEVKLLLATKTVPADRVAVALLNGETLIAENKVQELKGKYDALESIPHVNHFIGHLQSNKVKDIVKYNVRCLQSLDRLDLAEKLHQRLVLEDKKMDVLIQVNTSDEDSKFGIAPQDTLDLVKHVSKLNTLKIKGLMTIGLLSSEADKVIPCFRMLRRLQQEIRALNLPNVEMNELSMGMSGDLEIAIAEGATMVRVGTAIFGERYYPDSYYWDETIVVS